MHCFFDLLSIFTTNVPCQFDRISANVQLSVLRFQDHLAQKRSSPVGFLMEKVGSCPNDDNKPEANALTVILLRVESIFPLMVVVSMMFLDMRIEQILKIRVTPSNYLPIV